MSIPDRPRFLEVGMLQGGSAVFFDQLYSPSKLACVDIRSDTPAALIAYIDDMDCNHIIVRTGLDKSEKAALRGVILGDLGGGVDFVVDDASRFYEQSLATFEAVFPFVSPGGVYVIEDWPWSHSADAQLDDHF